MRSTKQHLLLLAVLFACLQGVLSDRQQRCRGMQGRNGGGGRRGPWCNPKGGQSGNNSGGNGGTSGGTSTGGGGTSTPTGSGSPGSQVTTTPSGSGASPVGTDAGTPSGSTPTEGASGGNTSTTPSSGNASGGNTSGTTPSSSAPAGNTGTTPVTDSAPSSASGNTLVFAHYMMLGTAPDGKYSTDINAAKSAGIDAFALNFGGWGNDFTTWEGYMKNMFNDCTTYGFKAFISFDMTSVKDPAMIIRLIEQYISHPAQLYYKNRPVVSSFANDDNFGFNWKTDVLDKVKASTGKQVYFLPGTTQTSASKIFGNDYADGVFTWLHPDANPSTEQGFDKAFSAQAASSGKAWAVGIAPWFFKHYTQYNWGNHQDDKIFVDRFMAVMNLPRKPDFIEFITWNDFGESSYFGQPNSGKYSASVDPAGAWATLDHSGFLAMAARMTKMFKQNINPNTASASQMIDKEDVYLYYRTQPWNTPGTNDPIGIPNVSPAPADKVFVVSFLKSDATITVTVGGSPTTIQAKAGLQQYSVPMKTGSVSMTASRNGQTIASKSPSAQIKSSNPTYNGNVVAV